MPLKYAENVKIMMMKLNHNNMRLKAKNGIDRKIKREWRHAMFENILCLFVGFISISTFIYSRHYMHNIIYIEFIEFPF